MALVLVLASPASALAQDAGLKGYRRFLLGLVGAAVVGVPAFLLTEEGGGGACGTRGCLTTLGVLMGGASGFFIGRELDARDARLTAAGPSFDYAYRNVGLDLVPDRMEAFPGGTTILGLGGARIVMRDGTVRSRATGVRGLEDAIVVPGLDLLVLSTVSNLLAFPVGGDTAQGQVIDQRGGGAMTAFDARLAVAGLDSVRLLGLGRSEGGVQVETLTGIEQFGFVTDMAFSDPGRTAWLLMDRRLVGYTAGLERVGELTLPTAGRKVRAQGSRLAVAAGSNGVYLVDVGDPSVPTLVKEYNGVRFAYAADFAGDILYVAAGREGVVAVDVSGAEPRSVGAAREISFANDVVVGEDGTVWILDRDGRRVQIAEIEVRPRGSR